MKASELMIGDWVLDTEFDSNAPRRVEIIEPRRVWLTGNRLYQPIGTIQPVPLTQDILKKNGMEMRDYTVEIDGWNLYYNTRERILYANDGGYEVPTICKMEYVHELQHILRLCGSEKNIEL